MGQVLWNNGLQDIGYQATNKSSSSETGTYDRPNILTEEGFQALCMEGSPGGASRLSGLQSQSWESRMKREGKLWGQRVGDERAVQRTDSVQRIDSETRAGDRIKAVYKHLCKYSSEENAATASTTKTCKKVLVPRRTVSQYYPPSFSYYFGFG